MQEVVGSNPTEGKICFSQFTLFYSVECKKLICKTNLKLIKTKILASLFIERNTMTWMRVICQSWIVVSTYCHERTVKIFLNWGARLQILKKLRGPACKFFKNLGGGERAPPGPYERYAYAYCVFVFFSSLTQISSCLSDVNLRTITTRNSIYARILISIRNFIIFWKQIQNTHIFRKIIH